MVKTFKSFDDLGSFINLESLYSLKLDLQAYCLDFHYHDHQFEVVLKTHAVISGLPSLIGNCS